MKIAYIGYDVLFPCLKALQASGCEIVEVFTCQTDERYEFNDAVRAFAASLDIPCHTEKITLADFARLKAAGVQAVFCAGYFYKIPIDHSLPVINVHPAILPIGRGAWPMPVAILRGLPEGGVTLHKMEDEMDAGDILLQQKFPLPRDVDLASMTLQIQQIAAELCVKAVLNFDAMWVGAVPQGAGESWPCPQKCDSTIFATTPPEQADRILRAFFGFDCWLHTQTKEICVVRGRFHPVAHNQPFGATFYKEEKSVGYFISGGIIEVDTDSPAPEKGELSLC